MVFAQGGVPQQHVTANDMPSPETDVQRNDLAPDASLSMSQEEGSSGGGMGSLTGWQALANEVRVACSAHAVLPFCAAVFPAATKLILPVSAGLVNHSRAQQGTTQHSTGTAKHSTAQQSTAYPSFIMQLAATAEKSTFVSLQIMMEGEEEEGSDNIGGQSRDIGSLTGWQALANEVIAELGSGPQPPSQQALGSASNLGNSDDNMQVKGKALHQTKGQLYKVGIKPGGHPAHRALDQGAIKQ